MSVRGRENTRSPFLSGTHPTGWRRQNSRPHRGTAPGDTAPPGPARHNRSHARTHLPIRGGEHAGAHSASKAFHPHRRHATPGEGVAAERPAPTRETGASPELTASTPQTKHSFFFPATHLGNPHRLGETKREAATSATVPGRGAATRRLSLGHLKGQPGPLQEHHGGPRQRRTHTPRRHGGSPPPKAEGGPHAHALATDRGWQARSIRCVSRPQGGVGAGFRTPAFHRPPRDGEERREAHGQDEKSGPVRHERPSLAWRGFGPAQESAKSPHRSANRREGDPGSRGPGEDHRQHGACFGLASPTPQGERQTTQTGERLTRGTEPWKRASSQTALGRCPRRGAHGGKGPPPPPPPPSGARDQRWHRGRDTPDAQEPARRPRRTAQEGRGLGHPVVLGSPEPPHTSRCPSPFGDTRQRTTCQHPPDGTKRPPWDETIMTRGHGDLSSHHPDLPEDSHGHLSPNPTPVAKRTRAPRANWSTPGDRDERGPRTPTASQSGTRYASHRPHEHSRDRPPKKGSGMARRPGSGRHLRRTR